MTTYYALCHAKREVIDPRAIDGGPGEFAYGRAANVIAHAMAHRWLGQAVTIEPDARPTLYKDVDDESGWRILGYTDITAEAVAAFNANLPEGAEPVLCSIVERQHRIPKGLWPEKRERAEIKETDTAAAADPEPPER